MIARLWRGRTTAANADAYHRHLAQRVFPALAALDGHRGARLLRRATPDGIEFLVVTLWESRAAISAFAGDDIDAAVVEPQARAVLADFDDTARHYDVVLACGGDVTLRRAASPDGDETSGPAGRSVPAAPRTDR
ncbi:MAG: antibiotic biosynthesis monooxygenase [Alphaproteobacteria bacterium]|nr:antibiotic biosynthesis monooxygenase [Alphaproteobacteria bacterium]